MPIHIATGDTSRYLRSAQVIGWADAAERIEELLEGGAFATNLEVTETPRYELLGIAVDVWNLYHDFSDEAKSLGYLSCLGNIHSTNFPEETERLTDDLLNPEFRKRLLAEYRVFLGAYRENRELLRFHYHKSDKIEQGLWELSLPRREYRTEMAEIPAAQRFITEDEIAATLIRGSNIEGSKGRIYAYFREKLPTVKSLQAEYSDLLVQKKLDYAELSKARDEAKRLQIYKANAEMLLRTDADDQRQTREHQQEK